MIISAVYLPDMEQQDQPFETLPWVTAVPTATNLPVSAMIIETRFSCTRGSK
ncbi:MAG: hypothetical protein WB762_21530 [Candidatus Sulfotelmatobacter sp.]